MSVLAGTCTTICTTTPGSCCQPVALTAGGADTSIKICVAAGNTASSSIACGSSTVCGTTAASSSITITDNLVYQTANCVGGDKTTGASALTAASAVIASTMILALY